MLRSVIRLAQSTGRLTQAIAKPQITPAAVPLVRNYSAGGVQISYEEQCADVISAFQNPDLDVYDFKVAFKKVYHDDNVPEPEVIRAALYACRRINDLPLAMRVLELTRMKCYNRKEVYDYMMQEIKPTMDDLGLKTVEDYGLNMVEE